MLSVKDIKAASTMLAERVERPSQIPGFCLEEGIDSDMLAEVSAAVAAKLCTELGLEAPIGDDGIDTDDPEGAKVAEIAHAVVQVLLLGLVTGMRTSSEAQLPDPDNLTDERS